MKSISRSLLARSLAAVAMVALYAIGIIGVSSVPSATQAQARVRGRGAFRGRGFRGRGRGIWLGAPFAYYGYDDGCYWSPRRGRYICPYAYSPYRYYW